MTVVWQGVREKEDCKSAGQGVRVLSSGEKEDCESVGKSEKKAEKAQTEGRKGNREKLDCRRALAERLGWKNAREALAKCAHLLGAAG